MGILASNPSGCLFSMRRYSPSGKPREILKTFGFVAIGGKKYRPDSDISDGDIHPISIFDHEDAIGG